MTKNKPLADTTLRMGRHGLVIYDGTCGMCTAAIGDHAAFFAGYGFAVTPIQTPGLVAAVGIDASVLLQAIHVITVEGCVFRGPEAFVAIASKIWWAKPLAWILRLPMIRHCFAWTYGHVAQRRKMISKVCGLDGRVK
jgi:hypothetical protein